MRYILGVLAVIIILITGIYLIIDNDPAPEQAAEEQVVLADYADSGATLEYFESGDIVAPEEHRAVRVTVSRNQRELEVISGYDGNVINRKTFPNTPEAFEAFVYALDQAGFANQRDTQLDTEKGVCPNGSRTVYTLRENSDEVLRLWSSSCSRNDGSFAGDRSLVEDLFEDQIPEFRQLTRGIGL